MSIILIVDDDAQTRSMIRSVLEGMHHNFWECEDGSGALDAYKNSQPDWVLMDISMNGMNGLQATRQIIGNFPEARIAIVTNYDDDQLRNAASSAGAIGYICKENLFEIRQLFR